MKLKYEDYTEKTSLVIELSELLAVSPPPLRWWGITVLL